MARKKSETAAAETAQDTHDAQEMSQDAQAQETTTDSAQEVPTGRGETIDPESEGDLLGCQGEAELEETEFIEYAVTPTGGLRLREEPRLDAPIITELPCGAGVFGDGEPGPDGWRHVFTGRLSGWMMDKYLEPLLGTLPSLGSGHGAD